MRKGNICLRAKVVVATLTTAGCIAVYASYGPSLKLETTGDSFFNELSCNQPGGCHEGNPLNAAGGTLTITGVPANYELGKDYPITVSIKKSGQARWGFEMAVRSESTKQQAGTFVVTNANLTQVGVVNGVQYIHHQTGNLAGTFPGDTAGGTWTFTWRAPAGDVGTVRFSCAANAANNNSIQTGDFIYTTFLRSNPPAAIPSQLTLFAHAVIGGGYTTVITLGNTGSSTAAGKLYLTDQGGKALQANFASASPAQAAPGVGNPVPVVGTSIDISVPSGATQIITAGAPGANDPATSGWARVESAGGSLTGVATFQLRDKGNLTTIAGVLGGQTTDAATIPVDDDLSANRFTGFAVANPGTSAVTIKIIALREDGTQEKLLTPVTLDPARQTAAFFFQDANWQQFKGSVVLIGQGGGKFSVVALVQNRGLYTAIPVIPSKVPGIN